MSRRTFTEEEVFNLELKAHSAGAESGRNDERRRIIALLESLCDDDPECVVKPCGCYEAEILLIKGENE